ncbi:hypothetical protein [Zooshikella ganghwensis]|uniref:hypothetical protein n=1 Tax=Zooshikella ganghwensis TaxID=202772 RepID=UPI000482DA2A|nr:hypothetical protein [Zooshikella ganghwensis]
MEQLCGKLLIASLLYVISSIYSYAHDNNPSQEKVSSWGPYKITIMKGKNRAVCKAYGKALSDRKLNKALFCDRRTPLTLVKTDIKLPGIINLDVSEQEVYYPRIKDFLYYGDPFETKNSIKSLKDNFQQKYRQYLVEQHENFLDFIRFNSGRWIEHSPIYQLILDVNNDGKNDNVIVMHYGGCVGYGTRKTPPTLDAAVFNAAAVFGIKSFEFSKLSYLLYDGGGEKNTPPLPLSGRLNMNFFMFDERSYFDRWYYGFGEMDSDYLFSVYKIENGSTVEQCRFNVIDEMK